MHSYSLTEVFLRIIAVHTTTLHVMGPMCWAVRTSHALASTWWKACRHPRPWWSLPSVASRKCSSGTRRRFQLCMMALWPALWPGLISQASLSWGATISYAYVSVHLCSTHFLLQCRVQARPYALDPSVLWHRPTSLPTWSHVLPMESWFNAHNGYIRQNKCIVENLK